MSCSSRKISTSLSAAAALGGVEVEVARKMFHDHKRQFEEKNAQCAAAGTPKTWSPITSEQAGMYLRKQSQQLRYSGDVPKERAEELSARLTERADEFECGALEPPEAVEWEALRTTQNTLTYKNSLLKRPISPWESLRNRADQPIKPGSSGVCYVGSLQPGDTLGGSRPGETLVVERVAGNAKSGKSTVVFADGTARAWGTRTPVSISRPADSDAALATSRAARQARMDEAARQDTLPKAPAADLQPGQVVYVSKYTTGPGEPMTVLAPPTPAFGATFHVKVRPVGGGRAKTVYVDGLVPTDPSE